MSKQFIITVITALVILIATGVAVFFAKGFTFSVDERRILGTGIISVTSVPDSASVYIDGHLTTATNATVPNLSPKKYLVKIVKERFIPWEREVEVKEGLVSELKVNLFPAIPTIYPLTFNGVENPVLSPDESKLAFIVPGVTKKSGVWVWTMSTNQPIAFARSGEPHQIARSDQGVDFSKSTLKWSSSSKEVLVTLGNNNYLMDSDNFNSEARDITPTLAVTLKTWEEDTTQKQTARVLSISNLEARQTASGSAVLKWSPDETKFMYVEQPSDLSRQSSDYKVYDLDTNQKYNLPEAKMYFWLPNSTHVVLVEEGKVSVVDFDGTNKAVIYAGTFKNDMVFAWPDSSRLVIISSFPTPTASEPNLYGINLK